MALTAEGAQGSRVWAVTSSWRGDLKFFGRIVQRAIDEVRARGYSDSCCIEFAVGGKDVESYDSVEGMLALVPSNTLRNFRSARVRVGSEALFVEMCFGRGGLRQEGAFTCAPGIAIEVTSNGATDEDDLKLVREAVSAVLERGAFFWTDSPTPGPKPDGPSLEEAQAQRWRKRELSAQVIFFAIAIGLLLVIGVVEYLAGSRNGNPDFFSGLVFEPTFISVVLGLTQGASLPLSTMIFPAIDVADITPGRRILQLIGRSGAVTTVIGLVVKGIFSA